MGTEEYTVPSSKAKMAQLGFGVYSMRRLGGLSGRPTASDRGCNRHVLAIGVPLFAASGLDKDPKQRSGQSIL